MDTKVIAMVGAVIVVGAAVYGVATGTVLPGAENITEEEPPEGEENTTAVPPLGSGDDEGSNEESENDTENVTQVVANETENVTDTGPEPLPVTCEERGGNIDRSNLDNIPSSAGPPLDPLLAESMLHDALNKVRAIRSDAEPLRCDPGLREIARNHSKLKLIEEGRRGGEYITSDYEESREFIRSLGGELELNDNIGEVTQDDIEVNDTAERYAGVCENPTEEYGEFLYQANTEGGDSGDFNIDSAEGGDDQELVIIKNHDDLVRDSRRHFIDNNLDTITDESYKRQGIGVAIDRRTREVYVTQVVCGPRNLNQTQTQTQSP